jgi:hypothetical protein
MSGPPSSPITRWRILSAGSFLRAVEEGVLVCPRRVPSKADLPVLIEIDQLGLRRWSAGFSLFVTIAVNSRVEIHQF